MNETLHRQWCMLNAIPRLPRKITVDAIAAKLASDGYTVTPRTIQRDLMALSSQFPLVSDTRSKPYGWSWTREARVFDIPGMDTETALTFNLAQMFLSHALPPAMQERLQPHFAQAAHVLKPSPLRRWSEHVRIIPRGQPLKAPSIQSSVVQAVYEALLEKRRLQIQYRSRQDTNGSAKSAEINPLGLVFRDNVVYLICSFWDYPDQRVLALHRVDSAEVIDTPANQPPDFDLDDYIREGGFDIPVGPSMKLVAHFTDGAAFHLHEGGLNDDQTLTPLANGWTRVEATVTDTSQLRWWLLGFGHRVEVIAPKHLRDELATTATDMAKLYSQTG